MKRFGYPKEYRGDKPWSDRPMRIINGKFFWEGSGGWWWSEDGDEFMENEEPRNALAPRPWRVDRDTSGRHWTNSCSIIDADGGEVCVLTRGYQVDAEGDGCPSWDNADLIVAAVNAYCRT